MMPDGCRGPWGASLWKSREPRKQPTNEPTMPRTSVPATPIGSRPGTTARAMKPAMAPTMISVMMKPSTAQLLAEGTFRLSPKQPPLGAEHYTPREVYRRDMAAPIRVALVNDYD